MIRVYIIRQWELFAGELFFFQESQQLAQDHQISYKAAVGMLRILHLCRVCGLLVFSSHIHIQFAIDHTNSQQIPMLVIIFVAKYGSVSYPERNRVPRFLQS